MQKIDFAIRVVDRDEFRSVILCENKRSEFEGQSAVWAEALDQVVDYAVLVRRGSRKSAKRPMYLTVNVGTYTRFYVLPVGATEAQDWAPARGRAYELADDEAEVWRLWIMLRDAVPR